MRRGARHRRARQRQSLPGSGWRAPRRRDLVARPARRHLHLQWWTTVLDRTRTGAGRAAQSGEKTAEEARGNLVLLVRFQHSHTIAAGTFANVGIKGSQEIFWFQRSFGFDVRLRVLGELGSETSNPLHWSRLLILRTCLQPLLLGAL